MSQRIIIMSVVFLWRNLKSRYVFGEMVGPRAIFYFSSFLSSSLNETVKKYQAGIQGSVFQDQDQDLSNDYYKNSTKVKQAKYKTKHD